MIDVGGAGVGLGVRAGVDGAHQGFDTLGVAPDRLALGAHTGSMLRFELAPGPRWLVGLELGADASLWRVDSGVSPTLSPQVVPRVALDLARY